VWFSHPSGFERQQTPDEGVRAGLAGVFRLLLPIGFVSPDHPCFTGSGFLSCFVANIMLTSHTGGFPPLGCLSGLGLCSLLLCLLCFVLLESYVGISPYSRSPPLFAACVFIPARVPPPLFHSLPGPPALVHSLTFTAFPHLDLSKSLLRKLFPWPPGSCVPELSPPPPSFFFWPEGVLYMFVTRSPIWLPICYVVIFFVVSF